MGAFGVVFVAVVSFVASASGSGGFFFCLAFSVGYVGGEVATKPAETKIAVFSVSGESSQGN